jgi:hypothetical protein
MKLRTLALRLGALAAVGALVPLALQADGLAKKGLPEGKENTIVIAQNAGNAPADIAMDVYTPAGVLIPGASRVSLDVAPGGSTQFPQAVNDGLVAGFRGLGVLSSDQPINGLLVRDILRTAATAAKSYSLANATGNGGSSLAFPLLFNELLTNDWNSRISVVNVGTTEACLRLTYTTLVNAPGSSESTVVDNGPGCGSGQGYSLAAGAQLTFSPEPGDTPYPASTFNNQIAVKIDVINASASNNIAAIADIYRSDGNRLFGSYNGLVVSETGPDDIATEVIVPIAMKSTSGFYTVIGVMNLGNAPANVTIQYVGQLADGTGANSTTTVTLNNIATAAFHSTYSADGPPVGFIGFARITSNQPIGAVEIRGKRINSLPTPQPLEAGYAAVNGVPTDRAATKWFAPLFFRRFSPGAPPTKGFNSWVQVQVPDGSAAQVTLRYVGDPASGCPVGPYQATHTVTNSKVFLANLDLDNGFPNGGAGAPSCFFGGLEVTANKPIIVITQVGADKFPGGDSEGVTNSFPAQ